MSRIEHLSDQLVAYSFEVAIAVKEVEEKHKFSREDAIKCVELAIKSMMVDVEHHKEEKIRNELTVFLEDNR